MSSDQMQQHHHQGSGVVDSHGEFGDHQAGVQLNGSPTAAAGLEEQETHNGVLHRGGGGGNQYNGNNQSLDRSGSYNSKIIDFYPHQSVFRLVALKSSPN